LISVTLHDQIEITGQDHTACSLIADQSKHLLTPEITASPKQQVRTLKMSISKAMGIST
jgi:hypothetical protein